jgi:hypothetical protein
MRAHAVVTITVDVTLTQPWSDQCTVGEVRKTAIAEAKGTIGNMIQGTVNIRMTEEPRVRIVHQGDI